MKNIIKENQAEDGLLYLLFLEVADDRMDDDGYFTVSIISTAVEFAREFYQ
jgi:hypothetical protein